MQRVLAIVTLVALAACSVTRTADVVPLNSAAEAIGMPTVVFTANGTGTGPVTVTMPDGEVLLGHFTMAHADGINAGPLYISAVGSKTIVNCQGQAGSGHGGAICRTNSGAQWQASF